MGQLTKEICCSNPINWVNDKFKDVIFSSDTGYHYTVYLQACGCCGKVIDGGTWVE